MTRRSMQLEAWIRRLLGVMCAAACCSAPGLTQAQASAAGGRSGERAVDEQWLFVPVLVSPLPSGVQASQLTAAFEIELRSQGQNVLNNRDAGTVFELRHSAEPVRLDSDNVSRLVKDVNQAARHLALGELPQAQAAMEDLYGLTGAERDYLNREAARARKIFDTCLMTAYLWEREHQRAQALRQMLECSRSFPGFRPEGRAYPPELREVFELAKQQLNEAPSTTLLVSSVQSNKCGVRLNGIDLGQSPISFSDVRAGLTRVQLECEKGAPGRIHSLELKAGENRLAIDSAFDSAAHSRYGLWLSYNGEAERSRRAEADLATLQKVIGANRIVQLQIDGSSYPKVKIRAMFGGHVELAPLSFSAGEGYDRQGIGEAIKQLRGSLRPIPPTAKDGGEDEGPIELQLPESEAKPAKPMPELHEQKLALGIVLAVVGAGGLATSWILYTRHMNLRSDELSLTADLDPTAFNMRRGMVMVAGSAGALVFAISEYFWLPDSRSVPTLAWIAGGLGVTAALIGLGFAVFGTHCDLEQASTNPVQACFDGTTEVIFGPLVALHALPLLAVPLSYAIRIWTRSEENAQTSLHVGAYYTSGPGFWIRGAF